jgi:hypothetical protein
MGKERVMEEKKVDSIRWIRCMFYLNVASLAISLLGFLPINNNWIAWPNRALTAATLYRMFCMGVFSNRYKIAAIFRTVQFAYSLISAVVTIFMARWVATTGNYSSLQIYNTVSTLIGSVILVLGWIGTYQLYHAHADLVAEKSPSLEKKWSNFFWVSLLIGIAASVATSLLALTYDWLPGYSAAVISTIVNNLSTKLVSLICVIYLYRTIGVLEKE